MFYLQSIVRFYQEHWKLIVKFYQEHETLIDKSTLYSSRLIPVITAFAGFGWWLRWRHRQRKIPSSIFPFDVIQPQCQDLKKRILGGEDNDPLTDRNIEYQQRVENRNIQRELQELLSEHRWVLIEGRTGIGKTREMVEVAEYFNQQGWTVLYLKLNPWLDTPPRMPEEIGTDRKLLFLIDDLNQKMHRGGKEISPKAEKSPVEKFKEPLQERLLEALERYEDFCRQGEVLVIATARNEKQSYFPGEPSPWEQLQWEEYPKLWQKFYRYELPAPSNEAIVGVLAATVTSAHIQSQPEDYPELARRNDATFSNVIVNLRRFSVDKLPLTLNSYEDSLKGSWEKRYDNAVKRYPASRYVYDAIDLLQLFGIVLQRFTVEPTARMIAGGNFWQRFRSYWRIRQATKFLIDATNFPIDAEGNLKPRDGQIEAKGDQVNPGEFVLPLLRLVLKLADKHREKMLSSVFVLGVNLDYLGLLEQAIIFWDKAIEIKPDYYQAWYNRGISLRNLGRNEEAIASYDQAIEIKPDYYEALYNRSNALGDLGRYEDAIASYGKVLKIKPDLEPAWYNQGKSLSYLGRYEEAIACWDKAIEFKPDDHQTSNNRGNALGHLGRYEEAIASYDKAIAIKPDDHEAWYNRGNALGNLGRYEDAIASCDKAIEFKPDKHEAWYDCARAYSCLGDIDTAIEKLHQAINLNAEYREIAKTDVNFDAIRNDERFMALMQH